MKRINDKRVVKHIFAAINRNGGDTFASVNKVAFGLYNAKVCILIRENDGTGLLQELPLKIVHDEIGERRAKIRRQPGGINHP